LVVKCKFVSAVIHIRLLLRAEAAEISWFPIFPAVASSALVLCSATLMAMGILRRL
jgi:hypothetical protein